MMTEEQVGVLRDQMTAIADIALACDAKVGNCDDIEERATIVQEHAAKIALAACALCPSERLADVAAIFAEAMPLALPSGHDGVEEANSVKPQYNPFMIGPFRIEHVSSKTVSVAKVRIGERVFSCEVHVDGGCLAKIFDNGKQVVTMAVERGKVTAFMIAVKAMKEYIHQLSGNRSCSRRGFLPREIAKMEAAK